MKATIKFGYWLVALWAVWRIGTSDTVSNAFMNLYVAGVVPGTHVVLTPGQEFWILGGLLFLAAFTIFFIEIKRGVQRLAHRWPTAASSPGKASKAVKAAKPAKPKIILVLPIKTKNSRFAPLIRFVTTATEKAAIALIAYVTFIVEYLVRLSTRLAEDARDFAVVQSVRLWSWAEPHLRDFDHYLNRRLHQNETSSAFLTFGNQAYELCREWGNTLSARLERALQKITL